MIYIYRLRLSTRELGLLDMLIALPFAIGLLTVVEVMRGKLLMINLFGRPLICFVFRDYTCAKSYC